MRQHQCDCTIGKDDEYTMTFVMFTYMYMSMGDVLSIRARSTGCLSILTCGSLETRQDSSRYQNDACSCYYNNF